MTERPRPLAGRLVPLRPAAALAQLRAAARGRADRPDRAAFDQPAAGPLWRRRGAAALHQPARLGCAPLLPDASAASRSRRISTCGATASSWQFVSCDDRAWHAGASSLARPRELQRRFDRHRARGPRGRRASRPRSTKPSPACCPAIAQRSRDRASSPATSTSRRAARPIPAAASTGACCSEQLGWAAAMFPARPWPALNFFNRRACRDAPPRRSGTTPHCARPACSNHAPFKPKSRLQRAHGQRIALRWFSSDAA